MDLLNGLPQWLSGKESASSEGVTGDTGSIPGLEGSPGGGHGSPPWYSCLENPMDRGVWRATVHRVAKSWTRLKQLCVLHTHTLVAQLVMNLPAIRETWVQSLDWKDFLEKGKATHSSILAWRNIYIYTVYKYIQYINIYI